MCALGDVSFYHTSELGSGLSVLGRLDGMGMGLFRCARPYVARRVFLFGWAGLLFLVYCGARPIGLCVVMSL